MKNCDLPIDAESCRSLICDVPRDILQTMQRRRYSPGELITPVIGRVDHVGYLLSGQAEAYAVKQKGVKVSAYTLEAGEFFGGLACLTDHKISVTLVCRQQADAFLQPYHDFMRVIENRPALKCRFLQSAFEQLWRLFQVVGSKSLEHPPPRASEDRLPTAVQKAVHFIDSHFELTLTINEVAQAAGLSKSALSRRFKNALGVSFKTYLNQLRISKARQLISDEGYNVTEACYAVGYNDTAYFSRTFRRIEGKSPSRLKNR